MSESERKTGADRSPTTTIIATRQGTHGVMMENSRYIQAAKDLMRTQPNWGAVGGAIDSDATRRMPAYQREALDMIQHKIGRILHGDPSYVEHWDDLAGYAMRVAKTLRGDLSP